MYGFGICGQTSESKQGTKYLLVGNFQKSIEVYSTMSETKAAFAERAIQSLKHIIYRYIEDHGEKFINKLPQFVSTMNCRINR